MRYVLATSTGVWTQDFWLPSTESTNKKIKPSKVPAINSWFPKVPLMGGIKTPFCLYPLLFGKKTHWKPPSIWVFPKIGGKPPKWMVKTMENPLKIDDLGVPLFSETSIYHHISSNQSKHRLTGISVKPSVEALAAACQNLGNIGKEMVGAVTIRMSQCPSFNEMLVGGFNPPEKY